MTELKLDNLKKRTEPMKAGLTFSQDEIAAAIKFLSVVGNSQRGAALMETIESTIENTDDTPVPPF